MEAAEATDRICREFIRATEINGAFHSAHEGLAVLQEEFEELKAEVFKKARERNAEALRQEATQVGAMALRFLVDLT